VRRVLFWNYGERGNYSKKPYATLSEDEVKKKTADGEKASDKATEEDIKQKITAGVKLPIPDDYPEEHALTRIMRACWNDTPDQRIPFSHLLDKKEKGLLTLIKKNVSSGSKKLKEKLEKDKEGEDIEFHKFWEKFVSIFGQETNKALPFIKNLLIITSDHKMKVSKKDVLRICDWLEGADSTWISEGFKNSFFYNYYMGEKNTEQIDKDTLLEQDQATLRWDPTKDAFYVNVHSKELEKGCDMELGLTTKTIAFDLLEKEAKKVLYKRLKRDIPWIPSTRFHQNEGGDAKSHSYSTATTDRIANIYVY